MSKNKITKKQIIEAAKMLRAEASGHGPILGFTLGGGSGTFSLTYDFDDVEEKRANEILRGFAQCLNQVINKATFKGVK